MTEPTEPTDPATEGGRASMSRRRLLGLAGVSAAAAGAAGLGGFAVANASHHDDPSGDRSDTYPFYGARQAGIVTPVQDRLHFAAFDVITDSRDELVALLKAWTAAAARMTAGGPAGPFGPVDGPYHAPPDDTGEAIGLPASRLTLTFGFGPTLFTSADTPLGSGGRGTDRFGLAASRPAGLIDLPHFPADKLDPAKSGGDLCVQACADDPQVAVHAIRNLARIGFGKVSVRWSQLGFGRTSTTSTKQSTPRNLFGFKDGTANIKAEETELLDTHVWIGADDEPNATWIAGGSYLIARRINMHIEPWDRSPLSDQEAIVGRDKREGAPLSGGTEFTELDLEVAGGDGEPLIPLLAHVRLAHPSQNDGAMMLRRGYNFTDGSNGLGRLDAGLFFIAYVRNPATQYVPMQTKLSRDDVMMEYLQHTGSGIFAIPPGISEGQFIGEPLFT